MKNEQRLKHKVAIITGGGKGIGKSIALAFAGEGASLVICGRKVSLLEQVSREAQALGASVLPVATDVTVESEVENMVEQTLKKFGKIDVLVNNAGVGGPLGLITDISKEAWDEVININLTGMFLCSKAVLRHMMKQEWGNIINMSSGAGRNRDRVWRLPYNVSKFGVEGMTYALAVHMKPYGICVNAIRPGRMSTDIHKDTPPEFKTNMRHPDEVKELAVFLALQTVESMTGKSVNLAEWKQNPEATDNW